MINILENPNPSGLCMCGCGSVTNIAPQSCTSKGWVRGCPKPYVLGHNKWTGQKPDERLWSNVLKTDGCWLWEGGGAKNGYGSFSYMGKTYKSHRFSWFLAHGVFPENQINHKCPDGENKRCVRPDHLYDGTHSENMRDAAANGRTCRGDKNGQRLHPEKTARGIRSGAYTHPEHVIRGSNHWKSKLTEDIVSEIKNRFFSGGITKAELGREYNVNKTTIGRIIKGTSWKHVVAEDHMVP